MRIVGSAEADAKLPAPENMEMEMKDRLTRVGSRIGQHPEPAVVQPLTVGHIPREPEEFTEQGILASGRGQIGKMTAGHDQHVDRRLGSHVREGDGVLGLGQKRRPEIAPDDPAKDTGLVDVLVILGAVRSLRLAHGGPSQSRSSFVVTLDHTIVMPELPEVEIVHLRMTGQLVVTTPGEPPLRFQHLTIGLAGPDSLQSDDPVTTSLGAELIELRYADQRKFGRVLHVGKDAREGSFRDMGPEPLGTDFSPATLAAALAGRRAPVKNVLLDQRRVAGLGNIYVDEALFRARIHPLRPAGSMSWEETEALHGAIVSVLEESLARRGTTFSSFLDGYGRQGDNGDNLRVYGKGRQNQPCPVCHAPLQSLRLAGRTSSYCPVYQPLRTDG